MLSKRKRQNGESQNGGNKKTKHAKFPEKTKISYPLIQTRCLITDERVMLNSILRIGGKFTNINFTFFVPQSFFHISSTRYENKTTINFYLKIINLKNP